MKKIRRLLKRHFGLPTPKQLGMSTDTAMPMRIFQSEEDTSPTWEDYEERMVKEYPVRYFLCDRLPFWLSCRWKWWVLDPLYWIKCHILPSCKFHWLDLRQPKKDDPLAYRYGWLETDHKMEFALFNILNDFVKHQMKHWYCPTEEEVEKEESLARQRNAWLETQAIHKWWNIDRLQEEQIHNDALTRWCAAKRNGDPSKQLFWDELHEIETYNQDKLEEMMIRLIKLRKSLWT